MIIRTLDLASDTKQSTREEIEYLKIRILEKAPTSFNMQDIYDWGDVPDLMMYVACHELVLEKKLLGKSPYDAEFDAGGSHLGYTYVRP